MVVFEDPKCFLSGGLLNFMGSIRVPRRLRIPEALRENWAGTLKQTPEDFVVTEPVPTYPGLADLFRNGIFMPSNRFLTIGTNSDMPGLRTTDDLYVKFNGRLQPAVALTVVKKGESTWRMTDLLSQHLSRQLNRHISHNHILTSGLKDRTAVTAQTVVVVGVSMREMRRVDWTGFEPGRRGFFVKDIRPTDRLLEQGDHLANGFEIKVRVPGKTRAEIEEYLYSRALVLDFLQYWIPNAFHLQRLGPTQDNHVWGRTLLTGGFTPPPSIHPFTTNAEAMLCQILCSESSRGSAEVQRLRRQMQGQWQYNFPQMERGLRPVYRRYNLTLEYEIVRRLADPLFRASSEAILYDLRDRLSIAVGAWQAVYWNWQLGSMLLAGSIEPCSRAVIPLAFSCEESHAFYGKTAFGRQCLRELAVTEDLAKAGEPYLNAFIDSYWQTIGGKGGDHPDKTGLSLQAVETLFALSGPIAGLARPLRRELSAALVRHLFLIPRELKSGRPKNYAPVRKAFMRASDFNYRCEDEAATLTFALGSGSYATMLVGLLFDTADPEELAVPGNESE